MEVEDKSLIFTFNRNAPFNFKQNIRTVFYHSGKKSKKRKKEDTWRLKHCTSLKDGIYLMNDWTWRVGFKSNKEETTIYNFSYFIIII